MTAINEALALHDADARAAIAMPIADRTYLRWQLDLAGRAMGAGFTRGWQPSGERTDGL